MKNIVLLHGALGDESQLFELKQELKDRFNCFNFSFHGHGKNSSDPRAFSIASFATELKDFILDNRLAGCDVFGYSMGGYVATYLCYTNTSLISKLTTYGTQFNWSPQLSAKEVKQLNPEAIKLKVPKFADVLEKTHGSNWPNVVQKTAGLMHTLGANNLLSEDVLQSIQNKITIVCGSEDNMVDIGFSKHVSLLLQNSNFHELTGAPHPLNQVDLKLLAQLIY